MSKISVFLGVAVFALAARAAGQPAGVHRGIFLGLGNNNASQSAVGELTPRGKFTIFPTSTNGPWPYWGNIWDAVQDTDNLSVIHYGLGGSTGPNTVLVRWDPIGQALTTLWARWNSITPYPSAGLTLNSDGNVVGYAHGRNLIMEFDQRLGSMTTFTMMPLIPPTWGMFGGLGGFEWDKLNGGYYAANSNAWANTMQQTLLWTRWDFQASSIVATAATGLGARFGGTLLENGDWVSSSVGPSAYLEVKAGRGTWTPGASLGTATFWDVAAEKFAAPGRGYYASFADYKVQNSVAYVDSTTTPHTVTRLATTPWANVLGGVLDTLPLFQRDLCTVRTGNRKWNIHINPDPSGSIGLAGKSYRLAVSLTGATPPITLGGGRQMFIAPDVLTILGLQGLLAPFLRGDSGKLDPFGKATAKLDLTPFGRALNGTVLHFCGVILDPNAPHGIAWILEPWAFVINNG